MANRHIGKSIMSDTTYEEDTSNFVGDNELPNDDNFSLRLEIDTNMLLNPLGLNHHGFNMYVKPEVDVDPQYSAEGMEVLEPMQFFNILMKKDFDGSPAIADPNYLLLMGKCWKTMSMDCNWTCY